MSEVQGNIKLLTVIVGLLSAMAVAIANAYRLLTMPMTGVVEGEERGTAALAIGVLAAGVYRILWRLAESVFLPKRYGPGIEGPHNGIEAVTLSLATTVPLTLLPLGWQFVTSMRVVLPAPHVLACSIMIGVAAAGQLTLYGTKTPPLRGLRNILFPPEITAVKVRTIIWMELVYGLVYFFSTVFPYQISVHLSDLNTAIVCDAVVKTISSSLIFFLGASTTVAIIRMISPDLLVLPAWVGVREMANGTILMVSLSIGILM